MGGLLGDGGSPTFRWRLCDLFILSTGKRWLEFFSSQPKRCRLFFLLSSSRPLFFPQSLFFACLLALLLTRHDRDVYVNSWNLFSKFFVLFSSRIKCAPALRMTDVCTYGWDGNGMGWVWGGMEFRCLGRWGAASCSDLSLFSRSIDGSGDVGAGFVCVLYCFL